MPVHRSIQSQGDDTEGHRVDIMGHWISVYRVCLLPNTIGFPATDEGVYTKM